MLDQISSDTEDLSTVTLVLCFEHAGDAVLHVRDEVLKSTLN